jgi:hypothetical protein
MDDPSKADSTSSSQEASEVEVADTKACLTLGFWTARSWHGVDTALRHPRFLATKTREQMSDGLLLISHGLGRLSA